MDQENSLRPTSVAASKVAIEAMLEPPPFKRSILRGICEAFADTLFGSSFAKKLPWWGALMTLLSGIGLSVAMAWSWFQQNAAYIMVPMFLISVAAFLVFRDGAIRREVRLLSEVNDHTKTEVSKAKRELISKYRGKALFEKVKLSKSIRDEWGDSNPLGRLISPQVLYCTLAGQALRIHVPVANVYLLPRTLRCVRCEVLFRSLDREYNEFAQIAFHHFKEWTVEIPGSMPKFGIPQQTPVEITDSELEEIKKARQAGNLEILIEMEFSVSAESDIGVKQFHEKFTFPTFVLIAA